MVSSCSRRGNGEAWSRREFSHPTSHVSSALWGKSITIVRCIKTCRIVQRTFLLGRTYWYTLCQRSYTWFLNLQTASIANCRDDSTHGWQLIRLHGVDFIKGRPATELKASDDWVQDLSSPYRWLNEAFRGENTCMGWESPAEMGGGGGLGTGMFTKIKLDWSTAWSTSTPKKCWRGVLDGAFM